MVQKPAIVAILPQNTSLKALFPNLTENATSLNVTIKELYRDFCIKSVIVDNKKDYDDIAMNNDFIYEKDQQKIDYNIDRFRKENWNKKTDFEKDWNRYPARHFNIKLRTLGIILPNLLNSNNEEMILDQLDNLDQLDKNTQEILAKIEHRRWCAEKWLTGFVTGESIEDKANEKFLKRKLKIHPDLVEWDDLPIEEQDKDYYTIHNTIYKARRELKLKDKIKANK